MTSAAPSPITVLVADDHVLLREALCELLGRQPGFRVAAQCGDGPSTVEEATRHRPDVILLDVEMPGAGVLRTICMLVQAVPESKIIVLTMHDDTGLPDSLIAAGATAYLHKGVDSGVLFAAIRSSLQGCVITALPTARESPTESGPLTRRQQQLMRHVAAGLSNRQIGVQLGITEGTVKRHLRDIFDRLGARSRVEAVNKFRATRPTA